MLALLAYADSTDASQGNFLTIFLCIGAMAAVVALAATVIFVSRRNSTGRGEVILTTAIFWGIVSFGTIIYSAVTQMKWAQEQQLELQSGYGNPNAVAPNWPWIFWGVLAVIYVLLLTWASRKRN